MVPGARARRVARGPDRRARGGLRRLPADWFQQPRGAGYAVPHWPAEWGGGMPVPQQVVLYQELAAHDAPPRPRLRLDPPRGLDAARRGHRRAGSATSPAILDGEIWCQGFSEPEAGSDLASLRTTARREGDRFVVNGQKLWASGARHADWCLLLARTDPDAPKRRGISYFLLDMRSPGSRRPAATSATRTSARCSSTT